ncbi:hypothetical protein [Pedobacter heparinus]|uniref:hypothetical protein n=1 Tax=Pedobacter heparinus TaxID=984 RepID=UPI00292F1729|nr:hypothetical protein [Pedobacter heparinus]
MKNKALDYTLILKLLIPMMLLLLLACYQLAFKKTWESYREYSLLKQQGQGTDRLSVSPIYTLARIQKVDELYLRFHVDTLAWKNTLWNNAAGLAQQHACMIHAYPPVKMLSYEQQQFYRQTIGFSGEFTSLLQLLRELSYLKNIGMLSGITYVKRPREKQLLLNVELLALPDKD